MCEGLSFLLQCINNACKTLTIINAACLSPLAKIQEPSDLFALREYLVLFDKQELVI